MKHVPDEVLDACAKVVTREITSIMNALRTPEFVPTTPTDYSVGTVLKSDDMGVLLRVRITAGSITVLERHIFAAEILAENLKGRFDKELRDVLFKTCLEFAGRHARQAAPR
jgi:hypothetical protein